MCIHPDSDTVRLLTLCDAGSRHPDRMTNTDLTRQASPSGLAIAGFVLSIIGFFSAFLGGVIITIPALIMCLVANKRQHSSLATAGWIIAAIATVLAILITTSRVMNS